MLAPSDLNTRLGLYDGKEIQLTTGLQEMSQESWLREYRERDRLQVWLAWRSSLQERTNGLRHARALSGALDWFGGRLVVWGTQLRAHANS
jgi:hypothetical protein